MQETAPMDRLEWLRVKRRQGEERYDALFAPIYDENWGNIISPTHERFFGRFLAACSPQALILDAACGTGKYWPLILGSGRSVWGIDQSQEMLNRARAKFPQVHVEKVGLQEMGYGAACDDGCCMDAMEHVFPEDWALVMSNLQRAIRPNGYLYFTVELADEDGIAQAYAAGLEMGLPVVRGEWAHHGGYHYYPDLDQVRAWAKQAGFRLIDEDTGDLYEHFLVQKPA